jgi:hypothetical protein
MYAVLRVTDRYLSWTGGNVEVNRRAKNVHMYVSDSTYP